MPQLGFFPLSMAVHTEWDAEWIQHTFSLPWCAKGYMKHSHMFEWRGMIRDFTVSHSFTNCWGQTKYCIWGKLFNFLWMIASSLFHLWIPLSQAQHFRNKVLWSCSSSCFMFSGLEIQSLGSYHTCTQQFGNVGSIPPSLRGKWSVFLKYTAVTQGRVFPHQRDRSNSSLSGQREKSSRMSLY